jgi:hypothetical protein
MDTYDLAIYQGQTFSLSLTLRDTNGTPINLAGYAISGFLKTKYGDSGKLTDLNVAVTDAVSGVVTLGIPSSSTARLPVNYAFYDIEMLNSGDGTVTKVLAGKASIYPEATF